MKKWHSFALCLMVLPFLSFECNQDNNNPNLVDGDTEMIFGTYFGFCAGNCVHLFKMSGGQLFADQMDRGNPEEATFATTPLSNAKYQEARKVMEQFPEELINAESTIGCPNCADQGGYFLKITRDGETFSWNIDTNEFALPEYLKPYAKLIRDTVEKLKN